MQIINNSFYYRYAMIKNNLLKIKTFYETSHILKYIKLKYEIFSKFIDFFINISYQNVSDAIGKNV